LQRRDAPAFFVETATHLTLDFRSVRDSGITRRFLAEHRAEVVQREAGHEQIGTTLGYTKEVQDKRGRYSEPFLRLQRGRRASRAHRECALRDSEQLDPLAAPAAIEEAKSAAAGDEPMA
jgi:hypothetical protein